jgi:hypothetical protein
LENKEAKITASSYEEKEAGNCDDSPRVIVNDVAPVDLYGVRFSREKVMIRPELSNNTHTKSTSPQTIPTAESPVY